MEQKAFSFDKKSIKKILKGAAIASGAALSVYILQILSQMEFGQATPLVVALCSIAINAIKEYVQGE